MKLKKKTKTKKPPKKQVNFDNVIQQKVNTQLSNFYTKLMYMKNMCYVYPVMYDLKRAIYEFLRSNILHVCKYYYGAYTDLKSNKLCNIHVDKISYTH